MLTTRWEARIDESHFLTGWRVPSVLKKDAQPEVELSQKNVDAKVGF